MEKEFRHRVELRAQDHYGKYDELVRVAGDVSTFLFDTFSFSRTKRAKRGLELHDRLIKALDIVPEVDEINCTTCESASGECNYSCEKRENKMLSKLSEMQDIIMQDWFMLYEPDVDEEGYTEGNTFTGEIVSKTTGDHVCWSGSNGNNGDIAMAEFILAAHEIYIQARDLPNTDDFIIPGSEADRFLRAFEEMVMKCAGT